MHLSAVTVLILALTSIVRSEEKNPICELLHNGSVNNITKQCMSQLDLLCEDGSTLWQMFDASSKYPISGMSFSSNKDLGNYDQCINIQKTYQNGSIKGKYCGFSAAVPSLLKPIPNPFLLKEAPKSVQVRDLIDELTITFLSMCIPDQCTPKEVGTFFLWGQFGSDINLVKFVDEVPCMTIDSNSDFTWGDIVVLIFLSVIFACVIASTGYDYFLHKTDKKPHHKILLAFSFITNGQKLLHISTGGGEQIQCLNGIRFISMMWVLEGHAFVALEQMPLINYKDVRASIDSVKMSYAPTAPIAVDTFFFLSGFLLSFGYLKSMAKFTPLQQLFRVPMMYLHRYLRLTPALAVVFLVTLTIFRKTGNGPLWDTVTIQTREQCENHWWAFFLYVQNYVNYNDMCLNHSWYLSADMQMFILAPLVLIPLTYLINTKRSNLAIGSLLVLIVICVIFPMGIRFADQTIDNVYDTHSRFNDYLIGVLLGVILRDPRFNQKFPFHKLTNLAIWCFVLVADVAFVLYYHSIIRIYEHTSDTLFYGLYRPIWSFSLFWMIYSCYHGYGGFINWFLSLPAFQIGARLSYCMYLLHVTVIMYFMGTIRTSYYWGDYEEFYLWCGHIVVTIIMAAAWSLSFESPMIAIEKFLFG